MPNALKARRAKAGGIPGALAATSCCIVLLVLFSLGISGAWIGNLTALSPYKPALTAVILAFPGCGFWMVYRKPRACANGADCARPLPNRLVKTALWKSTALIFTAIFRTQVGPVIAPIMLGL